MYEQYWGLSRRPFENDVRSEFFFRSPAHQPALLKLRYVVENRLGAALLAGGFGSGKTYLAHMLRDELPGRAEPVVHLVYPRLSAAELLGYLAAELGPALEPPEGALCGLDRTIRHIESRLALHTDQGREPLLIVDEAHLIDDPETLNALYLLLNFQQRSDINFTLLLIGDHSLLPRIERVEPLFERIGVTATLRPLNAGETGMYVRHRLSVAGRNQPIFDAGALESLFELSGGVPRKINRLCDLALLVGYADELHHISAEHVEAVAKELTCTAAA